MDAHKRALRKLKQVIKRAGSKHRRQQLKRELHENPDEAHRSSENLGRNRSADFNGLDADATRRTNDDGEPNAPAPGSP